MDNQTITPEQFDLEERRCPMLGHQISFSYCRSTHGNIPCKKILDCWYERLPIQDFIKNQYGEETLRRLETPSQHKVVTITQIVSDILERQNRSADRTGSD
jgi:hypothetical protein